MTHGARTPGADVFRVLVPAEFAGTRLDAFLAGELAQQGLARTQIHDWIKAGRLELDAVVVAKPGLKLRGGENLCLDIPEIAAKLAPQAGELDILYADECMLVLNKPAGLTVHPAPGISGETLVHRLLARFPELAAMDSLRPGVVHRLDKDTSGVMLIALTNAARLTLSADFAARRVDKRYLALVHGRPKADRGEIKEPIGRDPDHPSKMAVVRKGGREAITRYVHLWSDPRARVSLLHVVILTGRTHQIRVHLAHLGHPVVGDAAYGPQAKAILGREEKLLARLAKRHLLHAWRIAFQHPQSGEPLSFSAPPPRDLTGFTRLAARQSQRVALVGAIGGGKSEVLRRIERAGFPVFSADAAAAALYQPGADGWTWLRRRFGERFTPSDDAPVDKKALLAAMLESPSLRREVEDLIHPLVRGALEQFWKDNRNARAVFAEIPLFFEAGWNRLDPQIVTVFVDRGSQARLEGLRARGLPEETLAAMDAWQIAPDEKRARCAFVLDNSGPIEALGGRVAELLDALRRKRVAAARAFVFPLPQDEIDERANVS